MIICITGLPGSGKSTVANLLQKELKGSGREVRYYTSDWMRFKLFPELAENSSQRGRDFTPDELERSYNGLYMLFDELLAVDDGLTLLTDGTYRTESQRNTLWKIAARHRVPFVLIRVVADESTTLSRLQQRFNAGEGSGPESYLATKESYEEPTCDVRILTNSGNKIALAKAVKKLAEGIS